MSIRESFARPYDLPKPWSLAERIEDVFDSVIKPPERINPLEAAIKYYRVSNDYTIGPYDPEVTPYTKEVLEAMDPNSGYRTIVFVGPAQVGKTNMFLAWLMFNLVVDPADVFLVEKSMTEARDYSVSRFEGFASDNADIVDPLYKTGKTSVSIFQKFFTNGMILRFGWPSRNQLSGKAIARLWLSDYDRFNKDIGGEGEAFPLADKRRTTFGDRSKVIVESSPSRLPDKIEKFDPETPFQAPRYPGILGLYNTGDMRRWLWQCLGEDCQRWFEGNIDTMKWPGKGSTSEAKDKEPNSVIARKAWLECPHCKAKYRARPGKHLTEHYRDIFNANGRWFASGVIVDGLPTGEVFNPSNTASFWMKGPAARFTQWHELVKKYLDAKDQYDSNGTEGTLKGVLNTDWGEAWIPPSSSSDLTIEFLQERAAGPARGVVPHWVRYLIITIDVQKWSFELQAHGFGEQGQVCFIDRWNVRQSKRVRPSTDGIQIFERLRPGVFAEDFDILIEEALDREFQLEGDEGTMKAVLVSCDTGGESDGAGGGVSNNAYNFWRSLPTKGPGLQNRFLPLKGEPKPNAAETEISYPDSSGRKNRTSSSRGDVPLLMVGSTLMKDLAAARLYRQDPGPGFVHIPSWAEDVWYREMTAEDKIGGRWVKTQPRNESWDLYVYAHATNICRFLKGDQIDWGNPPDWAKPWGYNPFVRLEGHEYSASHVEKVPSTAQVKDRFAALAKRYNEGD